MNKMYQIKKNKNLDKINMLVILKFLDVKPYRICNIWKKNKIMGKKNNWVKGQVRGICSKNI
jgi:hypothetical protein